jgi:hypothetical protein
MVTKSCRRAMLERLRITAPLGESAADRKPQAGKITTTED